MTGWIVAGIAAWVVPSAAVLAAAWRHERRDRRRAAALAYTRSREAALKWALTEVARLHTELSGRQEEDHMRALVAQMPETVSVGEYRGYN